jgi:uncharacterized RDD family membrane protein YckC
MKIYWKSQVFHPIDPNSLKALTGLPLASFRRRVAAWTIDIVLVLGVFIGLYLLNLLVNHPEMLKGERNLHVELFEHPWGLALVVAYFGLMTRYGGGKTIGKRLLRIRVVSLSHERLTLWQCVERGLGYGFSSLEGGFGFLQYFLHPNRQTLHDRIAETVVLWDGKKPKANQKGKSAPTNVSDADSQE